MKEVKRYGIYFLTRATEAPQFRVFDDEKQRNEIYDEIMKTQKIDHGHKILDVIAAQKYTSDGERYHNYELMREQRLAEKVTT